GLGGLDDLVEHDGGVLGLVLARPLQHGQQRRIARGVARQRVLRHAAGGELVDAVAIRRPRQQRDDAGDRAVGGGAEIIAPERIEQLGRAVERRLDRGLRRLFFAAERAAYLLPHRGTRLLGRALGAGRKL